MGASPPQPPPIDRLKTRAQFLSVRHGAKAVRPSLMVEARRRDGDAAGVGVGFTTSRKIGNAVVRNRARRRLREAARQLLPELAVPGVDYVLVARAAITQTPWASLLDDLGNALIRLRAELGAAPKPRPKARGARPPPTESD